jgi:hypothetical protein
MAQLGVSNFITKRALGHADREITAVYDRYSYDKEVKAAVLLLEEPSATGSAWKSGKRPGGAPRTPRRASSSASPPVAVQEPQQLAAIVRVPEMLSELQNETLRWGPEDNDLTFLSSDTASSLACTSARGPLV